MYVYVSIKMQYYKMPRAPNIENPTRNKSYIGFLFSSNQFNNNYIYIVDQ